MTAPRGVAADPIPESASDGPLAVGNASAPGVGAGRTAAGPGGRGAGRIFSRTFGSLGNRHFRFLWFGSLLSVSGFQMQMIARTILVDDLTHSAFITGLVGMGFAPTMLVLSLFGGVAGDKLERRSLIQISQGIAALLSLAIATLIAVGMIHWVHMLAASMIQGGLFAFQMPARQAVIPKLVGTAQLTNAVALGASGMSLMAIVAPGIAGVIYARLGPEFVYFAIAGVNAGAVVLTGRIPRIPPEASEKGRKVLQDIAAGVRYVGSNRAVLLLLTSGIATAILAMPFRLMLPVFARRLYESDPGEIGLLLALAGVGGIIGSLGIANLRRGQHRGLIVLTGSILSGLALLVIGRFPIYSVGLAAMVAVGLAESTRQTLGQALTVELTDGVYRARVMSLFMMTYGLMPLGALPLGRAIDRYGAGNSLLVVALIVIGVAVLFLAGARTLRRLP